MDGSITAGSKLDAGAVFTVRLPLDAVAHADMPPMAGSDIPSLSSAARRAADDCCAPVKASAILAVQQCSASRKNRAQRALSARRLRLRGHAPSVGGSWLPRTMQ